MAINGLDYIHTCCNISTRFLIYSLYYVCSMVVYTMITFSILTIITMTTHTFFYFISSISQHNFFKHFKIQFHILICHISKSIFHIPMYAISKCLSYYTYYSNGKAYMPCVFKRGWDERNKQRRRFTLRPLYQSC